MNWKLADELKYDLHVLLVRHGKACPTCAKAGSAKQRGAAAAQRGGDTMCPLADLKVPPSKLKAVAVGRSKKAGTIAASAEGDAEGTADSKGKRRKVQQKADPIAE